MGVYSGIQLVLGVPTKPLSSYEVVTEVPIHCVKGHSGCKFCPDCGKPMTKKVESYDFTPLGPELAEVLTASWERWGEDFLYEEHALRDGFGIHALRSYEGLGHPILGYSLGSQTSFGSEETLTTSGASLVEYHNRLVAKADEYGFDPSSIQLFGHLYYS